MAFFCHFQLLCMLSFVFIGGVTGDGVCDDSVKGLQIVADHDDCALFYICYSGLKFQFNCASKHGPQKVFDPKSRTCVLRGSSYDHSACNLQKSLHRCIPGLYTKVPHEDDCSKYYQCTGQLKPVKTECPYPRLYDITTQKCEVYLYVNCRGRKEPKDPCDYDSNQCDDSGCIPCRQRFGTCIGYPDGPNQWEDKPWTPYFVICKDERVILQGDCRKSGEVNIFNPATRTCMPMSNLMKMAAAAKSVF